jgi:hypothetical protein
VHQRLKHQISIIKSTEILLIVHLSYIVDVNIFFVVINLVKVI